LSNPGPSDEAIGTPISNAGFDTHEYDSVTVPTSTQIEADDNDDADSALGDIDG
jgi:hypothetical protein